MITSSADKNSSTHENHDQDHSQHPESDQDHDHQHGSDHDHQQHHAHMLADFKRRFLISLIITVPVLILSPMIQAFFNYTLTFPAERWILWGLSTAVFFYGGWPFLNGLVDELKEKLPGMMTLIALAIAVAYIYSSLVVFGLPGKVFFWELVTLVDIMLLGHWIEMRSVMQASMATENLARLMPNTAHRFRENGEIEEVSIDRIQQGDRLLVKPGEKIPADGVILDGRSDIDESLLTGESTPVSKETDDKVIGGAVNGSGSLTVEVSHPREDSFLSQVIKMVNEAGQTKSKAQGLADKAAFWLTLLALTAGIVTLASWLIFGREFVYALERMVTVMVITCPHALGLAIPLVIAVITSLSAQNGLLIRNRTPFENARTLDTIVFDKTGTLTTGEFGVTDVISLGDWSEDELLAHVAAVEQHSEHTIARGILKTAKERNLDLPAASDFESLPGKGAKAAVDGREILIGNRNILDLTGLSADNAEEPRKKIAADGKTVVFAVADQKIQGLIGLADMIRDEAVHAVTQLRKMNLEIAMITGDTRAAAAHVADQLGLDNYFADVLPDKKAEKIQQLRQNGKKVAMVGDGVNDAPALAQADLGIAIGAGTDIAQETADIILVKNNPKNVIDIVSLSRLTHRKMLQNLVWATGYNVFAIPLAAGVLYRYGFILPPAVGALVMSASTVIVAVNAKFISYK